ncbi:hypothetical protein ScPMuIL_015073 [Solemya velum]
MKCEQKEKSRQNFNGCFLTTEKKSLLVRKTLKEKCEETFDVEKQINMIFACNCSAYTGNAIEKITALPYMNCEAATHQNDGS